MRHKILVTLFASLASVNLVFASTNDIASLVRNGLFEEEANHHFDAAVDYYKEAIGKLDKDRELVATAIFHLGECYRLQGATNDAAIQYQRIVREFPDQKQLVEMSKAHLPNTNGGGSAGHSVSSFTPNLAKISELSNEQREIQRINDMIQNSPDLINSFRYGEFPLVKAVRAGWKSAAKLLIEHGAEINLKSGETPMSVAVGSGNKSMVDFLLSNGADPNLVDAYHNWTPLYAAADNGLKLIAETLLAHGADVNQSDRGGERPLHAAVIHGYETMVKLLLAHHADVNAPGNDGQTPLFRAIQHDNLPLVRLLISNGANVNFQASSGETPLFSAVDEKMSPEIFKLLLDSGANPNTAVEGMHPLEVAVDQKRMDRAKLLLEKNADPNAEGKWSGVLAATPLIRAILSADREGKADMVQLLLDHAANPNLVDSAGETPLTKAVAIGNTNVVAALLAHHADVNQKDKQGNPPLACASNPAVKQMLTAAGANEEYLRQDAIFITQKGSGFIGTKVFSRTDKSFDRHTLYDLIAKAYTAGGTYDAVPFPDFKHVTINRLGGAGAKREIPVDLNAALKSGDCSKDVALEWGDIVLIPEADHKIEQDWNGLSHEERNVLAACLLRVVKIIVKGQSTTLALLPAITTSRAAFRNTWYQTSDLQDNPSSVPGTSNVDNILLTFRLEQVIQQANVLLISSDLSRVKVTRTAPGPGGPPLVLTCNLEPHPDNPVIIGQSPEAQDSPNDIQLMDGDVIEIPERPEAAAQK